MINENLATTRASLIQRGLHRLTDSNIPDARRNVEWMLCELLTCNRASLYAHPEATIPPSRVDEFETMLARRITGEPVQYILGYTQFYGLRIDVSPAVLIPRPETEQLVESALALTASQPAPLVLDIGTGSGCIPIAFQANRPEARSYACDISPAALDVARANAARLNIPLTFYRCDIRSEAPAPPPVASFDLIVSNPPYIPPAEYAGLDAEVRDFEPAHALVTDSDPLVFYRSIVHYAPRWLASQGYLLFETHADFADDVAGLLEQNDFQEIQVERDLAGRPRLVSGRRPV
jgi:release factor glutamine methyltransferase